VRERNLRLGEGRRRADHRDLVLLTPAAVEITVCVSRAHSMS
jgi:hypothetical protein